ncbi:hypothetical protein ACTGJ9_006090 [Bradyrhizobium sp. RDM12]
MEKSGFAGDHDAPFAGLAKIGDDEAAEGTQQSEGVRFATSLVWRRFMLLAFYRAVKARRVKLFARWPSPSDDFQELPPDIWPCLDVLDWEHGVARDIKARSTAPSMLQIPTMTLHPYRTSQRRQRTT